MALVIFLALVVLPWVDYGAALEEEERRRRLQLRLLSFDIHRHLDEVHYNVEPHLVLDDRPLSERSTW